MDKTFFKLQHGLMAVGIMFLVASLFIPFFQVGPYYDTKGYELESIVYFYIGLVLMLISITIRKTKIVSGLKVISIILILIPLIHTFSLLFFSPGTVGGWTINAALGTYVYAIGVILLWLSVPLSLRESARVKELENRMKKLDEIFERGEISKETYVKLKTELEEQLKKERGGDK